MDIQNPDAHDSRQPNMNVVQDYQLCSGSLSKFELGKKSTLIMIIFWVLK